MKSLLDAIIRRPVAVTMMFVAVIVFGMVSLQQLRVELMPDLAYPTITVRTSFEGAAPGELEHQVSRPIEEALATLDGLVTIESRSRAGGSDVILGFSWGTDMPAAVQAVREQLQMLQLPKNADRPLILRYDPSLDPFMRLALASDGERKTGTELYQLRELADDVLKRELEAIDGVAAVRVRGGLEREIRVEVRAEWLAARDVRMEQISNALLAENINLAGGSVLEGDVEFLVRTLNEFTSVEDIRVMRIARDDGTTVPLSDLAEVVETHRERDVVTLLDGEEAVEIELFKEADTNIVEISESVHEQLFGDPMAIAMGVGSSVEKKLPTGVKLRILDDTAQFIKLALNNLASTAFFGGLLAVLVLYMFLRDVRSTIIIGLAIPVSIAIAFGPLHVGGVSLNLMSLGGLALGVGMLVDNGVVVLESISRFQEEGYGRHEAATLGSESVAMAVIASTLTTVAVFLPVAFVDGVAGVLFSDLSLAVVSSLLASLAVALILVPMLSALQMPEIASKMSGIMDVSTDKGFVARCAEEGQALFWSILTPAWTDFKGHLDWLKEKVYRWPLFCVGLSRFLGQIILVGVTKLLVLIAAKQVRCALRAGRWLLKPFLKIASRSGGVFSVLYDKVALWFEVALAGALKMPGRVVFGAFAMLGLSYLGLGLVGTELIPELHQGRFTVEVVAPVGTPLERTIGLVSQVEEIVTDHPAVQTVYSTIGADRRMETSSSEGEHTAKLRVQLNDSADVEETQTQTMADLRRHLRSLDSVETKLVPTSLFSFRTPIELVIFGWDLDKLREAGDSALISLSQVEGLTDLSSSLQRGYPEVRIHYDRIRLHRFGLDPGTVARRVRDKLQGVEATTIRRGEQLVEIRVQLRESDRSSRAALESMNINPKAYPVIPLRAVADINEVRGPSEIRRVDQQRAVVISANVENMDLGSAAEQVVQVIAQDLDEGLVATIAGQSREMADSFEGLKFALLLALFLVYVIMASTFENLLHPFVILLSVPLALVGVTAGALMTNTPVSVVVFIGLIVLAGVVVNNAIVLVDTINRQRSEGVERLEAIRRAGRLRLRPILITTSTTVLGLAPLAMGIGAGAEVQRPLAVTVIFGLLSATMLTLVVVPSLYKLVSTDKGSAQVGV